MNRQTDANAIEQLAKAGAWFGRHHEAPWTTEDCKRALLADEVFEYDLPIVEAAALACWGHRDTRFPGRLREAGPWWAWVGVRGPKPERFVAPEHRTPPSVNHAAQIREQLAEQARLRAQQNQTDDQGVA